MTIGDIMTQRVITVDIDDPLRKIREILLKVKFHHLMVVEDKKLVGIISDRDLLKSLSPFLGTPSESPRDLAVLNKRAHQIMSRRPITALRSTRIEEAARLLLDRNISCLPVVSDDGSLEGIVTWKDLLRSFL
jgi:acetoin utilization protein AcuB